MSKSHVPENIKKLITALEANFGFNRDVSDVEKKNRPLFYHIMQYFKPRSLNYFKKRQPNHEIWRSINELKES